MSVRGIALFGGIALVSVGATLLLDRDVRDGLPGGVEPLPAATRSDFKVKQLGDSTKYWPRSAPVEEAVEYRFNTGHCGLDFMTDFDGSFWIPETVPAEEEPSFYFNEDIGTMQLLAENEAVYTSSAGDAVTLSRHPGPLTTDEACA